MNVEVLETILASIIVSAFYIQGQAYLKPQIYGQAIQSALISVLAFYLGYEFRSLDYILLGVAVVFLRSILITFFLLRGLKRKPGLRESTRGVASELVLDLVFFIITVIIVYYLILQKAYLVTEVNPLLLVFSFILFFQGLFLILSRKSTISQILGYIEEENSLILFGSLLIPIPFLIEVSVFLDVLAIVVISSILVLEKPQHSTLEELKG